MDNKDDIIEIDLMRIFKELLSHIWIIIFTTVVAASLVLAGTKLLVTPLYKASVKLYVNNSSFQVGSTSFSFTTTELAAAQNLVDTYIVILKTRTVLNDVIQTAQVDCTYEEMLKKISA